MPNVNAIATQLVNSDTTTRQMTTDPIKAVPDMLTQQESVDANAAAIKTVDQMQGTLLDIKG